MSKVLALDLWSNSIERTNIDTSPKTIIPHQTGGFEWESVQVVLAKIFFKLGYRMRYILFLFIIVFGVSDIAPAQEAPQAKKVERVQYYKVEYHKFKPGKADDGRAFIRKYYRPADKAAGIEVLEFTPVTGDWDWIAFFPVEADFLAWEKSPISMRARAKFEEMVGGPANAKKLDNEFNDLIQELKIEIMSRDIEN